MVALGAEGALPQLRHRRGADIWVVAADRETAWKFFGFTDDDCESIRLLDLGDRQLEVLVTPGHDAAAMTSYDRWTGFLLTGDTV